jgi:hypothetical protein
MSNRENTFLLKRSNVPGKIPSPGDLKLGEIALNTSDVKLYTSGTTTNSILPIGWDRISRTGDTVTGNYNIDGNISGTTFYGNGSNLSPAVASTGTVVHFSAGTIYNSRSTPGTGNITGDYTDAKIGIVQKIYHNDSVEPTFPVTWVKLGSVTYTVSTLNLIFIEWSGTDVAEYWISKTF